MRLDKFLCDNNIGTRSQVKEYIKKGQVTVKRPDNQKPETKVNEETDTVVCQDSRSIIGNMSIIC